MSEENIPAPPSEEELPPPPAPVEPAPEQKRFDELKVKKTKPTAALKRSLVIFGKDIRTATKHGLVGAIVAFVILAVVFSIASYAFERVVKMDIGGNGNGGNNTGGGKGPIGSGVNPPVARMTISPGTNTPSGTQLTFDASQSTDNGHIVFYEWSTNDGYQDINLYGAVVHFTFYAVGTHEVHLTVVDNDFNMNESLTTVNTAPATSDTQAPVAMASPISDINVTETVFFNGTASTDNVGVVNYTWSFTDGITRMLYGPTPSYTFQNAGNYQLTFTVRDASGNINQISHGLNVMPLPGDNQPPQVSANIPNSVNIGDQVQLDASGSTDNQGISGYTWYVSFNGTIATLSGVRASFTADKFGPYDVTLVVRDNSGNVNTMESTVIALPAGMKLNQMSWTTKPLPTELSYDLLSYAYGMALLSSVIFLGGLFAKAFKHEIVKGTARTLSLSPVSMTTMVFAKVLYAIVLGPIFVIPVVFIGLSGFSPTVNDVLTISLVSYFLTALTMVSGAYGSSLIYIATKKVSVKPGTLSRLFMYLSLIGTLSVFEGIAYLMNKATGTTSWNDMYTQLSGIATLSPFHFGGVLLSNMIVGTSWTLDWWIFVIPAVLIVGGVLASTRLYSDIFTKD